MAIKDIPLSKTATILSILGWIFYFTLGMEHPLTVVSCMLCWVWIGAALIIYGRRKRDNRS